MKDQWLKLASRIDALALRERVMIFAMLALAMVYTVYTVLAEPLLTRQQAAVSQAETQQQQLTQLDVQIRERISRAAVDPDVALRAKLADLTQQQAALAASLRTVQRGLVAPERMAGLLEQILQSNGGLKLMSLRSLPVTTVNEAAPLTAAAGKDGAAQGSDPNALAQQVVDAAAQQAAATRNAANMAGAAAANAGIAVPGAVPAPAPGMPPGAAGAPAPGGSAVPAPKAREMLYRHGVEMVLQGSYMDMLAYMDSLERLPVQLFWGRAQLEAGSYPTAKLTLTLYTLSLDDKWMKL